MVKEEILNLSWEQVAHYSQEYILEGKSLLLENILDKLREKGIHVTIQSNVNGYRIYWGFNYDEIYTKDVLDGVCRIGLIAVFDK